MAKTYAVTQVPNQSDEAAMDEFYATVGPKLQQMWDVIRADVDTELNGGVLTSLAIFFPNEY